jgi:hypothetical protein
MSKYLTAVLAAYVAAVSPVNAEERYDNYNDSEFFVQQSGDCSNEGRDKVIVFDNGAGKTWLQTNTTRWCNPEGVTINPTEDPVFRSEGS